MIIEIRGVGFVNKGAELMLHGILQKVKMKFPEAKFVIAPSLKVSPYEKRAKLGLYQKVTYEKLGIDFGEFISSCITSKRKEMYGLYTTKDVDIVLDASGFAHGDKWGVKNTKKFAKFAKKLKKNNSKLILLPQAFGPFENSEIKKEFKELIDNSDLVFARESISFDYVKKISNRNLIYNMPDFTNLVKSSPINNFDFDNNNFCIIPNYKMVNKKWIENKGNGYLDLIEVCIKYLRERNKKPFILVHEGNKDFELAQEISKRVSGINIFKEEDPLKVKDILKKCDGVIGSRFHSLVSSLSQCTPTLGTSWSHKYEMLFKDYNFEKGLLSLDLNKEEIEEKIDYLIEEKTKSELIQNLEERSTYLKRLSEEMWDKVFEVLETKQ